MPKLTDKQRKKVIADYVENGNYSETGRMNGITNNAVKKIVQKDETSAEKFKQKKQENTETTLEYMQKQHDTKKRILDKLLQAIEEKSDKVDMFTNIKDLATAYGILLDKELKVAEINLKRTQGNNDEINANIQSIAKLLNNPKENRTEENINE